MSGVLPRPVDRDPIDVTLIGSGRRGMAWLATLTSPGAVALGVRLAGVRDLDPAVVGMPSLAKAAQDLGFGGGAGQTAVVIDATSPVTRLAVTRRAMETGAHVLCDPPLALDAATALTMIGAAARGPGRLAVAYLFRRRAALVRMREMVASQRMGRPLALHVDLADEAQVLLGGAMAEAFDAGRAILGAEGVTVACSGPPCRATAQMGTGARLTIAMGAGPEAWRLEMEGGVVECGATGPARLEDGTVLDGAAQAEGRLGALTDFVEAIRTGHTPQCGPRSAAASLSLALAARASLRQGGTAQPVLPLGLMGDASASRTARQTADFERELP